jgi:cyclopropane fatty-acyl-phospholipid synthase-like methyltransferase
MEIFFELILLCALLYVIILLAYSLFKGAPYAAIGITRLEDMLSLLELKKGEKLIDIGSGDGRIVIAAAKKGLDSYGIEINPLLVLVAKKRIKQQKLKNAHILLQDCWKYDISKFDYITIWGTTHMMKHLEKKLSKELKPGAKVVSNHFRFPNWKYKKVKDDVYLYER